MSLSGGHSGRSHTFIVGLDDSRFPGTGLQDPLFLDGERRAVSPQLPTATGDLEQKIQDFHRLLARLRGKLTLSYSCHDLIDNREKFPSPLLMAAYRIISGNHEGAQEDFFKWMPAAVSFAPATEDCCLNPTEWWLWRLCAGDEVAMPSGWSDSLSPIWSEGSNRLNSESLRTSPNTTDMFPPRERP